MKDSSRQLSYEGKDVFIEIDVHKRTYAVVSMVEGEIVKKWQTSAIPKKLALQLMSYFRGTNLKSAYEAGFSGFILHRELEKVGIENLVVNPSSVEVAVHNLCEN